MKNIRTILLAMALTTATGSMAQSDLQQQFANPPQEARPRVWWHWMNGNISRDGIRKDLEWMHRVGISGVHLFDAGLNTPQIVPQRVKYMTPEWNDCLRLAVGLADSLGMDIVLQKGPGGGYFLASRPFELAELKLLAGAVQASKFLSERKSVALIEKLSTLCSSYQAAQLERQITVRDRVKLMNESIYYTVDRIHEAIAENKQIRFRYFDWGVDRRKHERPGEYFASPYALVWDNENYYLIAHSERHGLTHYRIDKMAKLSIADKPRVITEQARQLDLTRYGKTVFGMFSGTPQQVKLRFRNSLAGVVIDRFGKSAMLVPDGESHFTFTTEIVLSPVFYGWLAGFGEQAEIMFPASVREDFADLCRRTLSLYETSREE